MAPSRDPQGISGVNKDVFEGLFCACGNDAFVQLSRHAVDYATSMPGAFGSNSRIWCPKCSKFYTFRDGRWVDTSPVLLPPRQPKPERVAKLAKKKRT